MTTNKSQYTLTTQWIVPEDKKSEVESFFAEHEVWMRETHNLSGDDEPRIIDYSVSKAPQYIDNDLEKGPSGMTIYSLHEVYVTCLLYTSPSPRDRQKSRMPSSA